MMNDFSVDMNEYLPLRDVVFNTLRKAILKGELKPGERLMEIALAERLGVSRTPVREAMRKLELEGLVVMIPRRGAQVANITEKDLNDVLEVRIALENLSIENACTRMTEEQLEELWNAAKNFEATMAEGNLVKLAEADVAFHEVIYKSSDNRRLNQVLNNLRPLQQFSLLSAIHNPAFFQHDNLICVLNGGKAVGDHKKSFTL